MSERKLIRPEIPHDTPEQRAQALKYLTEQAAAVENNFAKLQAAKFMTPAGKPVSAFESVATRFNDQVADIIGRKDLYTPEQIVEVTRLAKSVRNGLIDKVGAMSLAVVDREHGFWANVSDKLNEMNGTEIPTNTLKSQRDTMTTVTNSLTHMLGQLDLNGLAREEARDQQQAALVATGRER